MKRPNTSAQIDAALHNDLAQLYTEPSGLFHELAAAAGLDPAADFRKRDLRGIHFAGADLSGFDFSGSDLRGTELRLSKHLDASTVLSDATLDPEDQDWRERVTNELRNELLSRLHELQSEHRDIDAVIARRAEQTPTDAMQLQRLKKRKITLRDEIARLEARLLPDSIA